MCHCRHTQSICETFSTVFAFYNVASIVELAHPLVIQVRISAHHYNISSRSPTTHYFYFTYILLDQFESVETLALFLKKIMRSLHKLQSLQSLTPYSNSIIYLNRYFVCKLDVYWIVQGIYNIRTLYITFSSPYYLECIQY